MVSCCCKVVGNLFFLKTLCGGCSMSVLDFLGKELLYFDGAMGTRLQAAGLKPG
jgi:hypothetical protein